MLALVSKALASLTFGDELEESNNQRLMLPSLTSGVALDALMRGNLSGDREKFMSGRLGITPRFLE